MKGLPSHEKEFGFSVMFHGKPLRVLRGEVTYLIYQLHDSLISPFSLAIVIISNAFHLTYDRHPFSHMD